MRISARLQQAKGAPATTTDEKHMTGDEVWEKIVEDGEDFILVVDTNVLLR